MIDKQTHWCRRFLQRHAELVYCSGGWVEGLGETAQQVAHLLRHMSHGDHFVWVGPGPDANHWPPAMARTVHPLGQLAEKEAAWQLSVELTKRFLVLQEIPQTRTIFQQQAQKLRLVANQGWEDGPVEITGLDGNKPEEHDEHPSRQLNCFCVLFGKYTMACLSTVFQVIAGSFVSPVFFLISFLVKNFCWCLQRVGNRQAHLPLALLSEDLSLSYVHSVPGYSQFQLPLPTVDSQRLTGLWSLKDVDVAVLINYVYLESKDWLSAVEIKCLGFRIVFLHEITLFSLQSRFFLLHNGRTIAYCLLLYWKTVQNVRVPVCSVLLFQSTMVMAMEIWVKQPIFTLKKALLFQN